MTEFSPAAKAVDDAFWKTINDKWNIYDRRRAQLAAALAAVADQVVPKEWPTIEDYNEYDQGFATAHIKHRNQILAIAEELKTNV
jgi:hypothetical protein